MIDDHVEYDRYECHTCVWGSSSEWNVALEGHVQRCGIGVQYDLVWDGSDHVSDRDRSWGLVGMSWWNGDKGETQVSLPFVLEAGWSSRPSRRRR